MTVDEFAVIYPQYAFDFSKSMKGQLRIHDPFRLDPLPLELEPTHPYHAGGRGRPNLNQSLTHSQCATCKRILRNDLFYVPPSQLRKNLVHTHCRDCTQQLNIDRYALNTRLIRARRITIWEFLAPSCAVCGFDTHVCALDMHHLSDKDFVIAELITAVTLSPGSLVLEKLLRESSRCIPLCSNCHRMLHAGVISLPDPLPRPQYKLSTLLTALDSQSTGA